MEFKEKVCGTCKYGKFDDIWGEWKCCLFSHKIYQLNANFNCSDYVRRKEEKDERTLQKYSNSVA